MKKIVLILLVCLSINIGAQTDIRTSNQYVVISSIDTLLLAEYMGNTRVETAQDVLVVETLDSIEIGILPLYDSINFFEINKLYNYNGQALQCLQSHIKTIYLPEQIPALFSRYRQNSVISVQNDKVVLGDYQNDEYIKVENNTLKFNTVKPGETIQFGDWFIKQNNDSIWIEKPIGMWIKRLN